MRFLSRHFLLFFLFFVVVAAFVGKAKWVGALKAFVKVLVFRFVATYFLVQIVNTVRRAYGCLLIVVVKGLYIFVIVFVCLEQIKDES